MGWRDLFSCALDYLFPPSCLLCGAQELYQSGCLICKECIDSISFVTHPLCLRCGRPFLTESERDHVCGECLTQKKYLTIVRALCRYEGTVEKMIHQFKYKQKFAVAPIFKLLLDFYSSEDMNFYSYDLFIPVPLHPARLRQRGFNQAVLWGEMLKKKYNVPLKRMALKRTVGTLPQVTLQGKTRRENVKNAFKVSDSTLVNDKAILLLDDVYTTGATMNECARVLKESGASRVDGFVIARAV